MVAEYQSQETFCRMAVSKEYTDIVPHKVWSFTIMSIMSGKGAKKNVFFYMGMVKDHKKYGFFSINPSLMYTDIWFP